VRNDDRRRLTNQELIRRISETQVEEMFARHHDVATMYFCESEDGDRWIAAPVDDLVDRFRQAEVRQYLFIDHGWVAPGGDVVRRDQIKKHPEAFEAVLFKAEDETGIVRGYRRIHRRPPSLGPLDIDTPLEIAMDEPLLTGNYHDRTFH